MHMIDLQTHKLRQDWEEIGGKSIYTHMSNKWWIKGWVFAYKKIRWIIEEEKEKEYCSH